MKFTELMLKGAFVFEPEKISDHRGFFFFFWCQNEFRAQGLNPDLVQSNISFNIQKGTLRGMHFQIQPFSEVKLVRCTRGAIYDVIVDLRTSSPTYSKWEAVELTDKNYKLMYAPEGFAHGYQTLADHTEVFYHVSQFYNPDYEASIRYNDPELNINWPLPVRAISEKDENAPLLESLSF